MPRAASPIADAPAAANSSTEQPAGVHGNPVLEFLDFIDEARTQPLPRLLYRVLLKARQLTDAEAGSIFLVHGTGQRRRLVPGSLQNDAVRVSTASFSRCRSRGTRSSATSRRLARRCSWTISTRSHSTGRSRTGTNSTTATATSARRCSPSR
jgi:hypothetical protein